MRNFSLILLLTTLFLFNPQSSDAQIGKLLKKTVDKTKQKIEDRVSEKASEKAADKVDEALFEDEEKQREAEAKEQEEIMERAAQIDTTVSMPMSERSMEEMLASMNRVEDVPEAYVFDLVLEAEHWEGNKKPEVSRFLYTSDGAVFGFEDLNSKEQQTTVIDLDRDIIVMYRVDKKGKKTAQAISNMMGLYSNMVGIKKEEPADEMKIEKTGKTKSILGYEASEYIGEDEDSEFQVFVTEALDINWQDNFGEMMKIGSVEKFKKASEKVKGMFLESHNTDKQNPKKNYHWVTKNISKEKVRFVKSEFVFENH